LYLGQIVTELLNFNGFFELMDFDVLLLLGINLQVHPGKIPRRQINQNVTYGSYSLFTYAFQIVSPALLLFLVSIDTSIPGSADKPCLFRWLDMLSFRVLVVF
jgi:hypothetical protein